MSAPTYNPATDTLIYAADSADARYADIATMGAAPLGTAPRLIPYPSPISDPPGAIDTTRTQLTTGKGGVGKAFQLTYPPLPSGQQQGGGLTMTNGGTINPSLINYIRVPVKITGHLDGGGIFAIKYFRFAVGMPYGGGEPQWGTHDHIPWSSGGGWPAGGSAHAGTVFEVVNGNNDSYRAYPDGHDQGMQPFGPYVEDMLAAGNASGTFFPHTWGYRPHQAALKADGVTKELVTITGTGTFTATAVFEESKAGKLTNGQYISIKAYGGKQPGGAIVSAFDGDKSCTLTVVCQDDGAQYPSGTFSTYFAIDLNGLMRFWIGDTLVMDVSKAGLNSTPPGGEKQYCGRAQLSVIPVDMTSTGIQRFFLGGVQTQPQDGSSQIVLTYNYGNGDPTNPDGLVWWNAPYTADSAQVADHLAITTQPSASTQSGQPHAQQPAGVIRDSTNATVASDTTTVTATLVLESGTGAARGTLSVNCVAGAFGFTNLGVDSAGGCTAHWQLSRPGLPPLSTASFTITPPPVASVPFRGHRAAIL